jgi:HK97 family phage major capsid protein
MYAHLWKMRDDNNAPVLYSPTGSGAPTLFGRPVLEEPGLAALGSATKSIVFGDLQQALTVVRRTPIDVLVSRHVYYSTDEVGVRVIDRSAGGVIDSAAAAYLVSANT